MTDFHTTSLAHLSEIQPADQPGSEGRPKGRARKRNKPVQPRKTSPKPVPLQEKPIYRAIRTWRKKDNREWSDVEIREFPETFFYNLHQEEWDTKASLAVRLVEYLRQIPPGNADILDVGCGCGWLANMILDQTGHRVTGIDIDDHQIAAARKIFDRQGLRFLQDDFLQTNLSAQSFDEIILMDSLAWMSSLREVVYQAGQLLKPGGSLHILATPFHPSRKVARFRKDFVDYCADKRMGEVPEFYTHFTREDLEGFQAEKMSSASLLSRLLSSGNGGEWIRIRV